MTVRPMRRVGLPWRWRFFPLLPSLSWWQRPCGRMGGANPSTPAQLQAQAATIGATIRSDVAAIGR